MWRTLVGTFRTSLLETHKSTETLRNIEKNNSSSAPLMIGKAYSHSGSVYDVE
jgi:hypothetical protein